MIYLAIALDYPDIPLYIQLMIVLYMNYVQLCYLSLSSPFPSNPSRRLRNFNEAATGLFFISITTQTDWIPTPSLRFELAWLPFGFIQALIGFNMLLVFYAQLRSYRLVCIKYAIRFGCCLKYSWCRKYHKGKHGGEQADKDEKK